MINIIWLGMIVISLIAAAAGEELTLTETIFSSAEQAVGVAFQ